MNCMGYTAENIRNIALLGHGGSGKTTLAESMLFISGAVTRQGTVGAGNTVSDYDAEEQKRQTSISATTMFAEFKGKKINIIDTPGYFDFVGEVFEALRVADTAVICVSAKDQMNVGAEKAWKYVNERSLPRAIYISKVDEEHANFEKAFDTLRSAFGSSVCALVEPIMDGEKVVGIVDVLKKKAYKFVNGKRQETDMPADLAGKVEEHYAGIVENDAAPANRLPRVPLGIASPS